MTTKLCPFNDAVCRDVHCEFWGEINPNDSCFKGCLIKHGLKRLCKTAEL